MLLRFIFCAIITLAVTSCIGLKPKPDNTKTFALGISNLSQLQSSSVDSAIKGYIAQPEFPVYMEGNKIKILSKGGEILNLPGVRWAESIDMGSARALSHYIETLSDSFIKSSFYPWIQPDETAFIIRVKFHHLIATDDGHILVSANWECSYNNDETQTGSFVKNTIKWSPNNPQSMIAGINTALELIASEIVETLKKKAL